MIKITIEGPVASGKSRIIYALQDALEDFGMSYNVVFKEGVQPSVREDVLIVELVGEPS